MRVLAVCNQKGGVGKTTTTFNLARSGARGGMRVLLIDADPQGNLTAIAAAEPVADKSVGLADVLSLRAPDAIPDVVVDTVWPKVSLVPTTGEVLGDVRDELVIAGAGREGRLRAALSAVRDDYDLVLIDCPPTLDQLTVNALTAAAAAVVVTHSKLFSVSGLAKLLSTIEIVRDSYNPGLVVGGVIINAHESRTVTGKHWLTEISANVTVLNPPVPKLAVINDAAEAARGLDEWGNAEGRVLAEIYDGYLAALMGTEGADRDVEA